jgi:hypothetical protein
MNPRKVEAISKWERPANIYKKNHSFHGLARYYKRFIEGFSTIATPQTRLTRKEVKCEWSKGSEKSF